MMDPETWAWSATAPVRIEFDSPVSPIRFYATGYDGTELVGGLMPQAAEDAATTGYVGPERELKQKYEKLVTENQRLRTHVEFLKARAAEDAEKANTPVTGFSDQSEN